MGPCKKRKKRKRVPMSVPLQLQVGKAVIALVAVSLVGFTRSPSVRSIPASCTASTSLFVGGDGSAANRIRSAITYNSLRLHLPCVLLDFTNVPYHAAVLYISAVHNRSEQCTEVRTLRLLLQPYDILRSAYRTYSGVYTLQLYTTACRTAKPYPYV